MNEQDKTIVENVQAYLGLEAHDRKDQQRLDLGSEHIRNYIENSFRLKTNKLITHDAIVTAFTKTHHSMYIDDPAFSTTFQKEMTGRAVPKPEIEAALDFVDKVLDDVFREFGTKQEKDGGWHPKLNEIEEVTKPEQIAAGDLDEGGLVKSNELGQHSSNIKSDIPLNREGKPTGKRIVKEGHYQGRPASGGTSETGAWDVDTPYGNAYVEATVHFDAMPEEPMTGDYPGSPGGIEVFQTDVHKVELYNDTDSGTVPVEDPEMIDTIKMYFDHYAGSDEMAQSLAEKMGEREETAKADHYDLKRRQMREPV